MLRTVTAMQAGGVVTLAWRPIAKPDVVAWAELLAAAEEVDHNGENYDADDLAEELADPALEAEQDSIGAWAGEQLVGYGVVRCTASPADGVFRVYADGCVHPEFRRRGIGRQILDGAAERAAELHAAKAPKLPAELVVYANNRIAGVKALAESAGMRPVRYWYEMDRDLKEPVEPLPVPQGLRLAPYTAAVDEQVRVAHNEAFAGHWGSSQRDEAFWRQWVSGARAFRPAVSKLLCDGDQIAGYVLVYEYEADTAATGIREAWIGQVGTRPPWRGRGVASALLTHVLAACRDSGFERASLSVDTGNSTGALGVYERAGFFVTEQATSFARPLG